MIRLVVPEGQNDGLLKNCIRDMLPQMREGDIQKLLRKGDVRVNGVRVKKDMAVHAGDVVELYVAGEYVSFLPKPEVVYEDENLIVFNKQPGISCISDKLDGKPTLYLLAGEYMKQTGEYSEEGLTVPYLCHRLDHYTGGLVIVAKSQQMFEYVFEAFKQRRVRKFYKALVCGRPAQPQGELHDFIIKDAASSKVKVVRAPARNALPAVTRYSLEKTGREISLLDVELVTGRTHQARAHLASAGLPILGDDKYGNRKLNKKYAVRYQALWAYKLLFETGVNNPLEYLNGKVIETGHILLPYVGL